MADDYRTWRKNRTMHDLHGSSITEIVALILPAFFCTIISTVLRSDYILLNFLTDFLVIVVPIVLIVTILAEQVYIVLLIVMLTSILFVYTNVKEKRVVKKSESQIKAYLTNARSTINVISVVAILAVDFSIFPKHFYKTENFGVSLMDVGAGLYVYGNGIVASEVRHKSENFTKTIQNCIPIFVIGILRFLSVYWADYYVPVTEYGLHWNFFITLAAVKFMSSNLLRLSSLLFENYVGFIGLLVVFLHEFFLQISVQEFVLNETTRDNLLTANKEGLVSSFGYLGIYLLSVNFGRILHQTKSKQATFFKILIAVVAYLALTLILITNFGLSRKLANSAFCCWIMFLGTMMTGLYFCWDFVQDRWLSSCTAPELFSAINYNPLVFFLVANIVTGLVNICFNTMAMQAHIGLLIVCLYMLINCSVIGLLYYKRISVLKLILLR